MQKNEYESSKIAIDPVIFTIIDKKLKVLLNLREKEPYKQKYELPGGLLLKNETAEETLKRKLTELLGNHNLFFTQFHTFTDPKRDTRERTVSIGFITLVNKEKIKNTTNWHDPDDIEQFAFDHKNIIKQAKNYLKNNINTQIISQFMPEHFPLNQLQEVYEIIEKKEYDNRNFRRKMITSELVEETQKYETNVSHRPAKLFRLKN